MSQGDFNGVAYNYNVATDNPFIVNDLRHPIASQLDEFDYSMVNFYSQEQEKMDRLTTKYELEELDVMNDLKYIDINE